LPRTIGLKSVSVSRARSVSSTASGIVARFANQRSISPSGAVLMFSAGSGSALVTMYQLLSCAPPPVLSSL
jgi:hypothetical protein